MGFFQESTGHCSQELKISVALRDQTLIIFQKVTSQLHINVYINLQGITY